MAAFVFKLTGLAPLGNRGRRHTMSDAAANRVIAAYRAVYGQIPSGPADPVTGIVPMRDMTDGEVVDQMFDRLAEGILANSHSHAREAARKTAGDAVAKDTTTAAADNA